MSVAQLEREVSLPELEEWMLEDRTRAADDEEARAEQKRLSDMSPEERLDEALRAQAEAGLHALTRRRRS